VRLCRRAAQPDLTRPRRVLAEPQSAADRRILKLLPTGTHLRMACVPGVTRQDQSSAARNAQGPLSGQSTHSCSEVALLRGPMLPSALPQRPALT